MNEQTGSQRIFKVEVKVEAEDKTEAEDKVEVD